jgi:glycosyltransferase involved in cell wall biosynthesis
MYILSIITICKNNIVELQKTLASLQKRPSNIQHIIIDGSNSTDIKNYLKNNLYSCEYYKQESSGIYSAINIGLSFAQGKYINILNSGDYHDEGVLEKIDFKINSELIAICTRMIRKNVMAKIWEPWNEYKKITIANMPMAHQSLFIHRDIYRKFGPYNLQYKYSSDYDFIKKVFKSEHLNYIAYKNLYTNFILGGVSSGNEAMSETLSINLRDSVKLNNKISAVFNFLLRKIKNKLNYNLKI